MERRTFITGLGASLIYGKLASAVARSEDPVSEFSKHLQPVGRALEMKDYYVGVYNQKMGLYMEAKDGLKWSFPSISYYDVAHYIQEPAPASHLKRYGRFERPQLLMHKGKPAYLFTAAQGGQYMTASAFILG